MSVATALVALLAAAPASGSTPERDAWLWNAPAACPAGSQVRAEVERHLGEPVGAPPAQPWSVVGIVTFDESSGYAVALAIETVDGRHDRLLHDPTSCRALSDSAALLIALAVGPDPTEQRSPRPPPQRPGPAPLPSVTGRGASATLPQPNAPVAGTPAPPPEPEQPALPNPDVTQPADPHPARRRLQFAMGLMSGVDWGTLRGVTPLGRPALSWQLPRLRVSVAAAFGANRSFDVPPVLEKIGLKTWSVCAEVGPVPSLGRFEFPLMAGIEAGQVLLTPAALLPPGSAQAAWVALLLTPGVSWVPLPWLALTARAGTTVSLVRPTFGVPGFPTIHAPAPVGVRASLGIEFRVPLAMKTSGAGNQP